MRQAAYKYFRRKVESKSIAWLALTISSASIGITTIGGDKHLLFGGHVLDAQEVTAGCMTRTRFRIAAYMLEHHRLPEALSELPNSPDYDESLIDGWGKPLAYSSLPDGSVLIRSSGIDGGNNARSMRFSIIPKGDGADENAAMETMSDLEGIEIQIRNYAERHKRLPQSLSDLPNLDPTEVLDGWERQIIYIVQPDDSVTLTSHGKPASNQIFLLQFAVAGANPTGPTTAPATERSDVRSK